MVAGRRGRGGAFDGDRSIHRPGRVDRASFAAWGRDAAEELRRNHDRLIAGAVEANRGRLVKNLGDGVMATFTGASDAVAAAVAIQQALDRHNRSGSSDVPLEVRIGVSAGDVAFEEADCFGTPVIEAARLCAAAGGGTILVTDVVRVLAGIGRWPSAHAGGCSGAEGLAGAGARLRGDLGAARRAASADAGLADPGGADLRGPGRGAGTPLAAVEGGDGGRAAGGAPGRRTGDRQDPPGRRDGRCRPRVGRCRSGRPV